MNTKTKHLTITCVLILLILSSVFAFSAQFVSAKEMSQISIFMTGQAIKFMTDKLKSGDFRVLSTIPDSSNYTVETVSPSYVSFKIGIRRAPDENSQYFFVNIKGADPESVSAINEGKINFETPSAVRVGVPDGIQMTDAEMRVGNAKNLTYKFKIFVCASSESGEHMDCDDDSPNLYGNYEFKVFVDNSRYEERTFKGSPVFYIMLFSALAVSFCLITYFIYAAGRKIGMLKMLSLAIVFVYATVITLFWIYWNRFYFYYAIDFSLFDYLPYFVFMIFAVLAGFSLRGAIVEKERRGIYTHLLVILLITILIGALLWVMSYPQY